MEERRYHLVGTTMSGGARSWPRKVYVDTRRGPVVEILDFRGPLPVYGSGALVTDYCDVERLARFAS